MSKEDEGGFLSRWSRRKVEARTARPEPAPVPAEESVAEEEEFDVTMLPSIESLTADSDFSLFLKKGVPAGLRAAALRKLWLVEPSVVNYKPLVEYNWDFTAPGYGDLLPTDDVAKALQTVFQGSQAQMPKPAEETPAAADLAEEPVVSAEEAPQLAAPEEQSVAEAMSETEPVKEAEPASLPRRRHGGALPG